MAIWACTRGSVLAHRVTVFSILRWALVGTIALLVVTCATSDAKGYASLEPGAAGLAVWITLTAMVMAPGVALVVQRIRHRNDGVSRKARQSAAASGIAVLVMAAVISRFGHVVPGELGNAIVRLLRTMGYWMPVGIALGAVGVAIILCVLKVRVAPEDAPTRLVLPSLRQGIWVPMFWLLYTLSIQASMGTTRNHETVAAKLELRDLVAAQEAFFADSGRYATSLSSLGLAQWRDVRPLTFVAEKAWWVATFSHTLIPGLVCGVAVGAPNPVSGDTLNEGLPVCR